MKGPGGVKLVKQKNHLIRMIIANILWILIHVKWFLTKKYMHWLII